ncbi:MAG: GHKL domain-containing protein [Myxococcaceae bacterium]|nr:GHKL domain-containing protein [Myxococcaceae bacterium]
MNDPQGSLRSRTGLRALRSILVGIIVVAASGLVGALVSYRADVAEARHQVRKRVSRQARASADSLAARFALLSNELQRFAHRRLDQLTSPDAELLAVIRDDRSLFEGGVIVVGLDGKPRWSDPPDALGGLDVAPEPWFQHVLATEQTSVDELAPFGSSRIAIAVPFRQDGRLSAVLVGIVTPANSLLTGIEGEVLLALSGTGHVLLPTPRPSWAEGDLSGLVAQVRASPGEASWRIGDDDLIAELFQVKGTALEVLALESEAVSVESVRRRLTLQLAFLSVLQLVTLAAFFWFLRATWRTFAEVEAAVAEQEKMVALGTAASLIAHEVKNSLNGLKAATSLLEAGGDASLASKTMKGQVERLGHLATSLLSFSRPTQPRRARLDTSAVVREAVQGLRTLPEYDEAEVELALPTELPLETDPLLLTTAVDNLVRNAIEAAVTAKDTGRVAKPRVRVSARQHARRVVIEVEDNAGGPPEGFEARLGEPFFTTKSRGIGLGLAMTRRAAEQLGGALRFERVAEGSRFSLELPA